MKVHAFILLLIFHITPAHASDQESCEAHIFPTNHVEVLNSLGNYGLITAALSGSEPSKELILKNLPYDVQFDAAKRALSQDPALSKYDYFINEKVIDYKSSMKIKNRLTNSQSTCYAELTLVSIVFSDTALTYKKIGIMSTLREFDRSTGKIKITKLGGAGRLEIFPSKDVSVAEAAKDDLARGFRDAFQQSVKKFLKPDR